MKSSPESAPLVAFGAHPDDLEFGCGGILAREAQNGRKVHLVVCSRGEAGTNGSPAERTKEAEKAAKLLGATLEFVDLDGDAHLEIRNAHALKLAAVLRRLRPALVLSPTTEPNQHPDHWRLGTLVRDATRLARYGNVAELRDITPHAVGGLFFYALGPGSEPSHPPPVLIDVSAPHTMKAWTAAMEAHASQMKTRNYVELQLARARVHGLNAGVTHTQPLWPNDPLVFNSLAPLTHANSRF
ncbi:MAG TPA: PIG-L family deacetylase [Lacunisphaera sp.]|nr:PIG-L family deacetylase [Lacunisphaera sp.]